MCCPAFFAISQKIFEMSERCNNSACFSVEIKGTSDICVTFVVYACGKSILGVRTHEKDTADRRQRHLYMVSAKILTAPGLPGKTACTLKEARAAIQEEMPLVVCCDLDLPDGSGMDFLDEVRAADKELPFILASCHDKEDYEQEAKRRGATLCMDKMKGLLLQDKLVEYAYRQLSGEKSSTFHKLLFVHAEDTNAGVLRATMLQKGFDLILIPSIDGAKERIIEDEEIELILCELELPDGTAMELFHTLRRVAGMFQMKNPPVRLLPFFILTENNDLATEYEYRHEGVNDYITAPVNIPKLIRRVLFFVE